jgi:hypothetical protein
MQSNRSDLLLNHFLNSSVNAVRYEVEYLLRGLGISELPKKFHHTFKNFSTLLSYTQKDVKSSKNAKKIVRTKYSTKTEKNGDLWVKTDGIGRNPTVICSTD